MKRFVLVLLLCVSFLGSANAQTRITLIHGWGTMEEDHVAMRQIYDDFEKLRPDIELVQLAMPSADQVISRIKDMLAVGDVPDVVFLSGVGEDVYSFMVEHGYTWDLAAEAAQDAHFAEDISPQILANWTTADGSLYTISDVLLATGYWCNRDLMDEIGIAQVPNTWDEFFEDCALIMAWASAQGRDVVPVELTYETAFNLLDVIVAGMGEESAQRVQAGELTLADEEVARAFEIISRICLIGQRNTLEDEYRDVLANFNAGRSVFYVNGIWASPMIDSAMNAQCVSYPSDSGYRVSRCSSLLGYVVGNTDNAETIEASVAFVKYMISDETQARILVSTSQYPSNPSVNVAQYRDLMPRFIDGITQIRQADCFIQAIAKQWTDQDRTRFSALLEQVLQGKRSPQEAAELLGSK